MEKTYELKPQVGKIVVELGEGEYMITREVSDSGMITIVCMPSDLASKELESVLGGITQELLNISDTVLQLQDKITSLEKEKLNIEKLLKR